jgi:hypothetical protein
MIQANQVIQDALAMIDVVSPGEDADPWFAQIACRILNGMLGEWSSTGLYNPKQIAAEFYPTTVKDYFELGIDDMRVLSNTRLSVVATEDPVGTYYRSVDGTVVAYKTTGIGTTYSLVVNADTEGMYYQINGGYSQRRVGDIPVNFAQIFAVQADLGPVVYSPKRITLSEYMSISVKQTTAPASYWAWDYQAPISKLYFFPRLLSGMRLRIVGQPEISLLDSSQSTLDLDMSWYEAVLYNLACRCYPLLKRELGIDKELVYMARKSLTGMRSSIAARTAGRVAVPYGSGKQPDGIWTSPLNTVTF